MRLIDLILGIGIVLLSMFIHLVYLKHYYRSGLIGWTVDGN